MSDKPVPKPKPGSTYLITVCWKTGSLVFRPADIIAIRSQPRPRRTTVITLTTGNGNHKDIELEFINQQEQDEALGSILSAAELPPVKHSTPCLTLCQTPAEDIKLPNAIPVPNMERVDV